MCSCYCYADKHYFYINVSRPHSPPRLFVPHSARAKCSVNGGYFGWTLFIFVLPGKLQPQLVTVFLACSTLLCNFCTGFCSNFYSTIAFGMSIQASYFCFVIFHARLPHTRARPVHYGAAAVYLMNISHHILLACM
jgi:hypothetical protein